MQVFECADYLGDAPPALAYRNFQQTIDELGQDSPAWDSLFCPLIASINDIVEFTTSPFLRIPPHPLVAARVTTLEQGIAGIWDMRWKEDQAPALLTGTMAHAVSRIPSLSAAAVGMVLAALAHCQDWPFPIGGSQAISEAMVADIRHHRRKLQVGTMVESLNDLSYFDIVILNTTPHQLLKLAGDQLSGRYRRRLEKFKYGAGSAKVDFALSEQIPWKDAEVAEASTVHLGGNRRQIVQAERKGMRGTSNDESFVLLTQPTVFDKSRAPEGRHVAWAYTHVPSGSDLDPTKLIIK